MMAFLLEDQKPVPALEPSRRNLVLSVIEEYHGPIVSTVADVMMRVERATLPELTRLVQRDQGIMGIARAGKSRPNVTPSNVKESLLILTQHNMVNATMPTEKELRRARTTSTTPPVIRLYYSLIPLAVLMRSRGPHFHFHASQKFGKVAGMIVDCFMRHGRRSLPEVKEELLERAMIKSATSAMANDNVNDQAEYTDLTAATIQSTFQELVVGKYIDKVPTLDLETPSPEPEVIKKASMTFAKIPSKKSSGRGDASEASNAKSSALASRQEKVAAQTSARKRRILGHDSFTESEKIDKGGLEDSDDEDELPIEMRNMVTSMGGGGSRQPASKRLKRSSLNGSGAPGDSKLYTATGRTRGRGRSRGRGGRGAAVTKGKGKTDGSLNMDGVFEEDSDDDQQGGAAESNGAVAKGAGAGATVLDGVVWKLGMDKFHRDFRHSALLGLVQDRFPKSKLAYMAVKVILENSAPTEREVKEEVTVALSAKDTFDKVCRAWTTNPLTKNKVVPDWKRFISWMTALCTDLTQIVSKVPGSDMQNPRYVVNMANMVRYMRSRLVKCTLRDKYGKETARILEILLQHKYLEQQLVSDKAMLPPSDARERLYTLLKERMVSMQEVPKRSDHNPNSTHYLWTIKHDEVAQVVLDSLYKAMLNMRLRRKFVYANEKELFIHDAAARVSNGGEKEKLGMVRRTLDRLDTALLRLDENLMFFNTF